MNGSTGDAERSPERARAADDDEVARLRERVRELEARLSAPVGEAPPEDNKAPQWTTLVIFGADGNLATKKTFPTLFALWRKKLLPRDVVVVGYARAPYVRGADVYAADESRRRRGCDVDMPWRRVAAAPRLGRGRSEPRGA